MPQLFNISEAVRYITAKLMKARNKNKINFVFTAVPFQRIQFPEAAGILFVRMLLLRVISQKCLCQEKNVANISEIV